MTQKQRYKIIVIVGPTASGKSELGVRIAHKFNGEIISADSRQVYRGLDAGSGKVRGGWQKINKLKSFIYKSVPHHCIDIADPKKIFTAADFVECGRRAIADILSRCKTTIIVGGTGFYIDALLGRVRLASVPPNPALRKKLRNYSTARLFNYVTKLNPQHAKAIDSKNPRRLIRAIEIARARTALGKTPGVFGISTPGVEESAVRALWLGIRRSPENLKKRIRKRLTARLPGIIREVKKLRNPKAGKGVSWKRFYDLGLEYRYVSLYVHGKIPYKQMAAKLQTASWHYARRQMTWWKKNKKIHWFNAPEKILKYLS